MLTGQCGVGNQNLAWLVKVLACVMCFFVKILISVVINSYAELLSDESHILHLVYDEVRT